MAKPQQKLVRGRRPDGAARQIDYRNVGWVGRSRENRLSGKQYTRRGARVRSWRAEPRACTASCLAEPGTNSDRQAGAILRVLLNARGICYR